MKCSRGYTVCHLPDGYETKQYYTNRNFLAAAERVISATESNITRFEYDKAGNTTKVIKGLNSWQDKDFTTYSYEYDSLSAGRTHGRRSAIAPGWRV
ncbi:hypothetical protein [Phosphitispora sp. TUW77]|uniref:hypothetical protein n=1 Tax=Phosphitispora sp. TUW77 TaxID=3152361 RepID=UPI003AB24161